MQVGTFIRPVGVLRFSYCYEVLGVHQAGEWDAPGHWRISLRRWGLDEQRRAIDDGRVQTGHGLSDLQPIAAGKAWRALDATDWAEPMYWRPMLGPGQAKRCGQLELWQ